jgi:DNA repair exonuclease SbcCD nuclease subunit
MLKILFLADTHIGFDDPQRKRVVRRRRGNEFWHNYLKALDPAFTREVDLVIHGGDLLYRSKVPSALVSKSFAPLIRIAEMGIPVVVVPGNHERGHFDRTLFDFHSNLHIFEKPKSIRIVINGINILLAGFPFVRDNIRQTFAGVLQETGWQQHRADVRLLCFHQNVDGASVGPAGYTFRKRPDTIDINQIPGQFNAALTGHIHRYQVLNKKSDNNPHPVPVIYPGSTERTSFAEIDEDKGYVILKFVKNDQPECALDRIDFQKLDSRPMLHFNLDAAGWNRDLLTEWLREMFRTLPEDSLIRLQINGRISRSLQNALRIKNLRLLCPPSMNIYLAFGNGK